MAERATENPAREPLLVKCTCLTNRSDSSAGHGLLATAILPLAGKREILKAAKPSQPDSLQVLELRWANGNGSRPAHLVRYKRMFGGESLQAWEPI